MQDLQLHGVDSVVCISWLPPLLYGVPRKEAEGDFSLLHRCGHIDDIHVASVYIWETICSVALELG